ncbi:hypothetical protein ABKN59_010537 [Abortiporus biennis]
MVASLLFVCGAKIILLRLFHTPSCFLQRVLNGSYRPDIAKDGKTGVRHEGLNRGRSEHIDGCALPRSFSEDALTNIALSTYAPGQREASRSYLKITENF